MMPRRKGEEMTEELAALWLQQHESVNRYVMTSTDLMVPATCMLGIYVDVPARCNS